MEKKNPHHKKTRTTMKRHTKRQMHAYPVDTQKQGVIEVGL